MCENSEAEIELVEAAYGNLFKLILKDNYENIFEIKLNENSFNLTVIVRFIITNEYPLVPLRWYLTGDISNNNREIINQHIQLLMNNNQDNSIGNYFSFFISLFSFLFLC